MPMPGDNTIPAGNTGNLIMNMLFGQQNDPAQQMSDWANTQQARNRVAVGEDLQGNLLPSPAPGTPPGVGSGQITGAPQDPTAAMAAVQQTGVLPPSQTPNAYQTDQSLGSMIIALQRRQEADAGLNQSLGLAGAAISRPENRERVSRTFNTPYQDATKLGDMLMNMSLAQQGVDRGNALAQQIMDPQRGPQLAGQLNISWGELQARYRADPVGVGTMIANFSAPTEATKNYNQARAQMKAQGMTDEQINAVMPPEMLALGGVSDPGHRQFVLARTRAIQNGQALPPELQDYPTYQASKAAKAKLATDNAADLSDAQGKLAPFNQRIDETNTVVDRIKSNPKLDSALTYLDHDRRRGRGRGGQVGHDRSANLSGDPGHSATERPGLRRGVQLDGFEAHPAGSCGNRFGLKPTEGDRDVGAGLHRPGAQPPSEPSAARQGERFWRGGKSRRPVAGTAHEGRSDLFARRSALRRRWRRVGEADRRLGSQGTRQASEGSGIPSQIRSVCWRSLGWLQG